jgi:hypothetical protein
VVSFTAQPTLPVGWEVGWTRTGLDDVEKLKFVILPGLELQSLVLQLIKCL